MPKGMPKDRKQDRPLTSNQRRKFEAMREVARIEATRFASEQGIMGRLDEVISHADESILLASRDHDATKSNVRTFARFVVRRSWRAWFRIEKKRRLPPQPDQDDPRAFSCDPHNVVDREPSPAEQAEKREDRESVHRAIGMLSSLDREVIRLLFFEHETLGEVAKKMGCTFNRVHQMRNEALRRLRLILDPESPDEGRHLFSSAA